MEGDQAKKVNEGVWQLQFSEVSVSHVLKKYKNRSFKLVESWLVWLSHGCYRQGSGDMLEMEVKGEEVCQKASGLKRDPHLDRVGDLLLQGAKPAFSEAQKVTNILIKYLAKAFPVLMRRILDLKDKAGVL